MSNVIEQKLIHALEEGLPIVAFLGQGCGYNDEQPDEILASAIKRIGRQPNGWKSLLETEVDSKLFAWMAEKYVQSAPSAELCSIADTPFSAVYTSSIDPRIRNLFETNGREPETVLVGDPPPAIKRGRRTPPFYFLFGRAGDETFDFQPPSSPQQLAKRRMLHASPMARTLADTATALGLIVVDGFDPGRDWFRAEDLLALLADAPLGSVIWFGGQPSFRDDDQYTFEALVKSGIITVVDGSLGSFLAELSASKPEIFEHHWNDAGVITFASGNKLVTSPSLRLSTEASATIVDDAFTDFIVPLTVADKTTEFRAFHSVTTNARALISGVRNGFAIERIFEEKLQNAVNKAVARHHEMRGAIILHGQSGSGKSIAVARLALRLREQKSAAVLYALNALPQPVEVAEFLAAVDSQNEVTVILADASAAPHRYDDLLDALRSRGHRVVVVGTSYKQEAVPDASRSRYILASAELDRREKSELDNLASAFLPQSSPSSSNGEGQYALAGFFYRIPVSRGRIAEGLGREARHVGGEIAQRGSRPVIKSTVGDLGRALVAAGFPAATSAILSSESPGDDKWGSEAAANRLIDYVMTSARLYRWVPVNLLLRAVKDQSRNGDYSVDLTTIRDLFEGHDLFRWRLDDEEGQELLVGARLQLEAELICNRRLGGAVGEANRLVELISVAVRAGSERNIETRFLVDLIHAFGPDGPFKERYSESYAMLARALTQLRVKSGVENARLMLQEATLRRHYVRLNSTEPTEKAALLDEARDAIDTALARVEAGRLPIYASRRTIDNLWVERAATYGFIATDAADHHRDDNEVWSSYQAARNAARKASGRVDNYYPLDIALWMPARILKSASELRPEQMAELQADIRATLDLVEPNSLDAKSYEIFQRQKMSCADVLDDAPIADDAYEKLKLMGSTAGIYLRARSIAPVRLDDGEDASERDQKAAELARHYLWNEYNFISSDMRCLQLLLSCEWTASTHKWLFRGLRQPIPHDNGTRQRLRRILAEMINVSSQDLQTKFRYLEAVMSWLVDDERAAIAQFRQLASETEFIESGRVLMRHEISDESGKPAVFSGTVTRKVGDGRWAVSVKDLRREVDLISSDFKNSEISRGTTVRSFTVGFNFLGPLAKPAAKP